MMGIIPTFVGYNILHVPVYEHCLRNRIPSPKIKNASLRTTEDAAKVMTTTTMNTVNDERWTMDNNDGKTIAQTTN